LEIAVDEEEEASTKEKISADDFIAWLEKQSDPQKQESQPIVEPEENLKVEISQFEESSLIANFKSDAELRLSETIKSEYEHVSKVESIVETPIDDISNETIWPVDNQESAKDILPTEESDILATEVEMENSLNSYPIREEMISVYRTSVSFDDSNFDGGFSNQFGKLEKEFQAEEFKPLTAKVDAEPKETPKILKTPDSDSVIERFIKENPSISRPKAEFFNPVSVARHSAEDAPDDLVSETLAQIYVKQGLQKKAIQVYEKLILIYPHKIAYFADLINKLKSINNL